MSIVTILLNFIQKAVFVMLVIPAAFKIIEFLHNHIQTVETLRNSLKDADHQINQLQQSLDSLKYRTDEHNRLLREQTIATTDIQQQLIDQNIDAIDTTKQIEEVYDCLDLLDDRLLEIAKYERTGRTKKPERNEMTRIESQKQKQKQEIEALDRKLPNEEIFDQFVADALVSDPGGQIGKGELRRLFREWREDIRTYISNEELEEYMSLNFDYSRGAWTGIKSNATV